MDNPHSFIFPVSPSVTLIISPPISVSSVTLALFLSHTHTFILPHSHSLKHSLCRATILFIHLFIYFCYLYFSYVQGGTFGTFPGSFNKMEPESATGGDQFIALATPSQIAG